METIDYQRMHAQLLDMLGAKDHEDAARIIAGHHAREIASQPAVAEVCAIGLRHRFIRCASLNSLPIGTKLYTDPPPAAGVPDELVRMTIGALDDVDTEMRATGRATNRFSQLASYWRGMLSATPSPEAKPHG